MWLQGILTMLKPFYQPDGFSMVKSLLNPLQSHPQSTFVACISYFLTLECFIRGTNLDDFIYMNKWLLLSWLLHKWKRVLWYQLWDRNIGKVFRSKSWYQNSLLHFIYTIVIQCCASVCLCVPEFATHWSSVVQVPAWSTRGLGTSLVDSRFGYQLGQLQVWVPAWSTRGVGTSLVDSRCGYQLGRLQVWVPARLTRGFLPFNTDTAIASLASSAKLYWPRP